MQTKFPKFNVVKKDYIYGLNMFLIS